MNTVKWRRLSVVPQCHHFKEFSLVWKTLCYLHNTGEHTLETKLTPVVTAGRLLAKDESSQVTREFIHSVMIVAKPLTSIHTSPHTSESTLERNLINAMCVARSSVEIHTLQITRGCTPARNLTSVMNAAELLASFHTLADIRKCMLERNHTNAMRVASTLPSVQIS